MSMLLIPDHQSQASAIHGLLLKKGPLTAKEIAKEFDVFPNAVYRAAEKLIVLGLIEKIDTYPIEFKTKPTNEALRTYHSHIDENFFSVFSALRDEPKNINVDIESQLDVSFINSRDELLNKANEDTLHAEMTIDHIVSGLEVPAETIFTFQQAINKGVRLRFLVQKLDEVNREMLHNWQKMGVEVRYFPLLEARIIILDSKIVYITSYNPQKKEESVGARFSSPAIAKLINELFEKRWNQAKLIN